MYNTNNLTKKLLAWYSIYQRDLPWRKTQDPYKIWLSEIMLQQTQVDTVMPYYTKWINKYPRLKNVAEAEEGELLKIWEGLGYYNRCRNFKKAADIIIKVYSGKIPSDYDAFIQIRRQGNSAHAPFEGHYSDPHRQPLYFRRCDP